MDDFKRLLINVWADNGMQQSIIDDAIDSGGSVSTPVFEPEEDNLIIHHDPGTILSLHMDYARDRDTKYDVSLCVFSFFVRSLFCLQGIH